MCHEVGADICRRSHIDRIFVVEVVAVPELKQKHNDSINRKNDGVHGEWSRVPSVLAQDRAAMVIVGSSEGMIEGGNKSKKVSHSSSDLQSVDRRPREFFTLGEWIHYGALARLELEACMNVHRSGCYPAGTYFCNLVRLCYNF